MLFIYLIVQTKTVCFDVLITLVVLLQLRVDALLCILQTVQLITEHLSVRHNSNISRENLVNNSEIIRKHRNNFRMFSKLFI